MTNKIDRRIVYYMTIDTETANGLDCPLAYDLGLAIHDKRGKVYEKASYVIYDVYATEKTLMKSAYYANKLPKYEQALKSGERKMISVFTAKKIVKELCDKYNVKAIIAHNARFDYRSLTTTMRYTTKSKYRYFLPYGIELWDSMVMAEDTICKQKTYIKFCKENGYLCKNGKVRKTAEILYRYITGDNDFTEEHQGLDDVLIEIAITTKCMAQHKSMRKLAFPPKKLTMYELINAL